MEHRICHIMFSDEIAAQKPGLPPNPGYPPKIPQNPGYPHPQTRATPLKIPQNPGYPLKFRKTRATPPPG